MSCPNYIRESTNNAQITIHHLNRNRFVDIACISCIKIYRVFSHVQLETVSNNTLSCKECNIDAMIPIISTSILYKMEPDERVKQMINWNIEWFTPIIEDESYIDYDYDEDEETKETSFPG